MAVAAALACAVVSCGGEWGGETLKWKSAVDIPVNHTIKVGWGLDTVTLLNDGGMLMDLGTETFSTESGAMDIVRKMTDQKFSYRLSIANHTIVKITLYGLLFDEDDGAARMDMDDFYGLAGPEGDHSHSYRIDIMHGGLIIEPDGTGCREMPVVQQRCKGNTLGPEQESQLNDLILKNDAISWRWLAKIEASQTGRLDDTASTSDSINMQLAIRVSGVNDFESIFSLNKALPGKYALMALRGGALP